MHFSELLSRWAFVFFYASPVSISYTIQCTFAYIYLQGYPNNIFREFKAKLSFIIIKLQNYLYVVHHHGSSLNKTGSTKFPRNENGTNVCTEWTCQTMTTVSLRFGSCHISIVGKTIVIDWMYYILNSMSPNLHGTIERLRENTLKLKKKTNKHII